MQKSTKEKIYIRRSAKFEPVIQRIELFASKRPGGQLTSTLLEMAALGIKSYEAGFRLVDDNLLKVEDGATMMNVRKEVGRSVFSSFAGAMIDLKKFEKNKSIVDQEKVNFYTLTTMALASEYANFSDFTEDKVDNTFEDIAPILKKCVLADNNEERESIIEQNKHIFLHLIDKTGVFL